jgi:hypothetical protein
MTLLPWWPLLEIHDSTALLCMTADGSNSDSAALWPLPESMILLLGALLATDINSDSLPSGFCYKF